MEHSFKYWNGSLAELAEGDAELVTAAREAASQAYAPITHFGVGAAARLKSGAIIAAHNIESPIGVQSICAERNLLLRLDPADPFVEMAIAAQAGGATSGVAGVGSDDGAGECYPCGVCRQAMIEAQARQGAPMRLIMAGTHTATVVDNALHLLPFPFILN